MPSEAPKVSFTVLLAFLANLAVAIAKTIVALFTASASITAEAAHSWADVGNEVFLLVADRRGARKQDAAHPLGFGRETYFWSTIAAFGLFTAGAVFSIVHGIQQLSQPERSTEFWIAYLVLGVSAIFESVSFLQALRQARAGAKQRGRGTLQHVLQSSNSTLRAVFAEDSAALVGLVLAFLGVLLHQLTGSAVYDAVGSILIGVLLAIVALVLIERNRRFLVGQEANSDMDRAAVRTLLEQAEIDRVTYVHLEFVGPERIFLVAAIDLAGDEPESAVAVTLRALEDRITRSDNIEQAVLTLSTASEPSLEG